MISANVMQQKEVQKYFTVMCESVIRSHLTMTAIFLTLSEGYKTEELAKEMSVFLQAKLRKTDLLFQLDNNAGWGIIFLQSGEVEARAFLNRIFDILKKEYPQLTINASITEIRNNNITFDALITANEQILSKISNEAWVIEEITDYQQPPTELVKVSIIEENDIFRHVLEVAINQLEVPHFSLEVSSYEDGYSFWQSGNYQSAHTHLIIVNDILPRKNGFELLHSLRMMPNGNKFIIYMMSERNSEAVALNAYESGVDEFIIKPFNLRLIEAKIKRTFARLWP